MENTILTLEYPILRSLGISILIFLVFFSLQLIFLILTKRALKKMSAIFSEKNYGADVVDGVLSITHSLFQKGSTFDAICNNINHYIRENSDNIDLGEMKDITNRLTDIEYEKATAKISYPMYIGLMGTYIGVGFGLLWLVASHITNSGSGVDAVDTMFDVGDICVFIGGVAVAMLTSFVGLLFTTLNNRDSVKYAAKLDSDKDDFFAFLQTKIMPQLPSTLAQTLREQLQTSIGSLGSTISSLNTTVNSLNSGLRETFQDVTHNFGTQLRENLAGIHETVNTLTESARSYAELMQVQDSILQRLNSPEFVVALTRINRTVGRCEDTASVLQQADETATALVNKQRDIIETQANFERQQEESMTRVLDLHNELSRVTLQSQEAMNALTNQPNQMFDYIRNTMEQFHRIERFVEEYANINLTDTNQRVAFIDTQLQSLRGAQESVHNFCAAAETDLKEYLKTNRENLQTEAQNFVQSWNDMFAHMAVNGAQNPLAHLAQLSTLSEKVDNIADENGNLYRKLEEIRRAVEVAQNRANANFENKPKNGEKGGPTDENYRGGSQGAVYNPRTGKYENPNGDGESTNGNGQEKGSGFIDYLLRWNRNKK